VWPALNLDVKGVAHRIHALGVPPTKYEYEHEHEYDRECN